MAVLPLENLSPDANDAYFADGLHEEVLNAVAKVSALKVIARTSVLPFADAKQRSLPEIAAKLGVASLVEGTVRRSGNRLRISVRLVDPQSSRQLWGESYEEELTDMFAVQSAIAKQVAATLNATLTAGESATLGRQLTQSAEAYRLYLQGKAALGGVGLATPANRPRLEAAVALFEQATAADPMFVLPYVEVTRLHGLMFWFGYFDPRPEQARLAEISAARVQELAPGTPEAHLAVGYAAYHSRNDWAGALTEFRAAVAGLPNSADATRMEAIALRRLGRWSEAIAALVRTTMINPQDMQAIESLVETRFMARRFTEVIRTAGDFSRRGIDSDVVVIFRAAARLALDGDVETFRRTVRPVRANALSGFVPTLIWRGELLARDFAGAEAFFSASNGQLVGPGGVVNNPVAQFRALVAFVQGDAARAMSEASSARAFFESKGWTLRQQPLVAAELALANALAGDAAKARTELARSRELLRRLPDAFAEIEMRYLWMVTYAVLGDREAVLTEMRIAVTQASPVEFVPSIAPLDPLWASLKSDPRFEEILKSAMPL